MFFLLSDTSQVFLKKERTISKERLMSEFIVIAVILLSMWFDGFLWAEINIKAVDWID